MYHIPVRRIDGTAARLLEYEGRVMLIVNVASACGLTPQYEALEKLYQTYRERGLVVLGFPANEFGAQEPGTNAEIQEFCRARFDVQFPLFEKIVVKGFDQHPLYQALTSACPEADSLGDDSFATKLAGYGITRERPGDVLWNFEKFLVNRRGQVVARFAPNVTPDQPGFVQAIEAALAEHER